MTKRLSSKHKIDRRLGLNLWGRPKSLLIEDPMVLANMVKQEEENLLILEFNWQLNKSSKNIMAISLRNNF